MRRFFIMASLALASGCSNQSGGSSNATSPVSTVDLLKSGDASACSQQDVRDTLISQVKPSDKDRPSFVEIGDYQNGQANISYNIDTISLSGVDKAISSVKCDANLIVHYKDHEDKTFSVSYEIRPSVENSSSFIIHSDASDAHAYAITASNDAATAITTAKAQAQQAQQAQQEQAQQAQQAQAPADNSVEGQEQSQPQTQQDGPPPTNLLPSNGNQQ